MLILKKDNNLIVFRFNYQDNCDRDNADNPEYPHMVDFKDL